jgi:hypothetical protein
MGLKLAQEQAGHADISTTADIYTHVDVESKVAAASVLGDAFEGVLVLKPVSEEPSAQQAAGDGKGAN